MRRAAESPLTPGPLRLRSGRASPGGRGVLSLLLLGEGGRRPDEWQLMLKHSSFNEQQEFINSVERGWLELRSGLGEVVTETDTFFKSVRDEVCRVSVSSRNSTPMSEDEVTGNADISIS